MRGGVLTFLAVLLAAGTVASGSARGEQSYSPERRQQDAFGQQLAHDANAPRAERRPHGNLF